LDRADSLASAGGAQNADGAAGRTPYAQGAGSDGLHFPGSGAFAAGRNSAEAEREPEEPGVEVFL
jgi:hypothetical protein